MASYFCQILFRLLIKIYDFEPPSPHHRRISTILAKKWIFPLDLLIWKLNRKSRKLFGVLDNQPFSRWIRWGGWPYWRSSIKSRPITATPSCPQMEVRSCVKTERKLVLWCRSCFFFAGFRNHGSRQQRHLADTYKASSDQPFHQRTSKSGLFAARQPPTTGPHADQAVAKLIREKPTAILSTEQFVPIQSVELKLSGKVLVLPAPTPSDPSFLANDFICPPVRYLSKWKLDSKYRQMLQQLDNWQSWKGHQTWFRTKNAAVFAAAGHFPGIFESNFMQTLCKLRQNRINI